MTRTEQRLYGKSEKAETLSIELQETIHGIFYDPEGASEEDVTAMAEILGLLKEASKIAAGVEKRLHG